MGENKGLEILANIFSEKDVQKEIKDIILDRFRSDMEALDIYIFDPDRIQDMITEAYEDILREVKSEMKAKVIAEFDKIMKAK